MATRKNMKDRREKRQKEAKERQAAYDALSPTAQAIQRMENRTRYNRQVYGVDGPIVTTDSYKWPKDRTYR